MDVVGPCDCLNISIFGKYLFGGCEQFYLGGGTCWLVYGLGLLGQSPWVFMKMPLIHVHTQSKVLKTCGELPSAGHRAGPNHSVMGT